MEQLTLDLDPPPTPQQLRRLRSYHGWSVAQAARELAVLESTWRRWERGDSEPRGHSRHVLRRLLNQLPDGERP